MKKIKKELRNAYWLLSRKVTIGVFWGVIKSGIQFKFSSEMAESNCRFNWLQQAFSLTLGLRQLFE